MRVEILEKKLRDAGHDLVEGDTITVSDELGARWCALGWARDTDGKVATAERSIAPVVVNPKKATHAARARNAGDK